MANPFNIDHKKVVEEKLEDNQPCFDEETAAEISRKLDGWQ